MSRSSRTLTFAALSILAFAAVAGAVVTPQRADVSEFRVPAINIAPAYRPATALGESHGARLAGLAALGVSPEEAFLDLRSDRWGTLMPTHPLLPGTGVGNTLEWSAFGGSPASTRELERLAWEAFASFLERNRETLRIDPTELPPRGKVTIHDNGDLIQIYAPRVIQGVLVRDASLTAVVNHGNLVLFGAIKWGDVSTAVAPSLDAGQALAALSGQVDEVVVFSRRAPYLTLVPAVDGSQKAAPGAGYDYKLAWVLSPSLRGDQGQWEALVDAHTGDVLALQDRNQYGGGATKRRVMGGVLPVTNDGVPPDGVEQAGWPMSWSDVTAGADTSFTDAGGNAGFCTSGSITSTLDGQFMLMNDNCGPISLTSSGDIDFGTSGGTDCVTPGFGGAGNTHASRSGFFEMNQIKAQARGQLPNNPWPPDQLQANMNIVNSCNAFWNGSTVNFYRSGACANTGELAAVYDHEWGHGMDNFDAVPTISSPGEGIADIYAALRLNTSCIGRNFRLGTNCPGYGDACTSCDGVRDIDWANRVSGLPHTITGIGGTVGIDSLCGSGGGTPCGGSTHCEGAVYAEAAWDMITRDFPAAGYDHVTAIELATRLTYLGGGNVGNWFQCVATFGGCNADGGYLNYLAADDDNGNLADGTPNMTAIFDAFDRHEIACGTPTVQDGGCAAGPSTAPVINSVTAIDKGAVVDFTLVTGATSYEIYRTDGVFDCNQGKIKVGTFVPPFSATESSQVFVDDGIQNGREYWYTVIAVGDDAQCRSPAATCTAVTPADGPNLALATGGASFAEVVGDSDGFLDNCEEVTVSFDVNHIGTGAQTDVRIVSITPLAPHDASVVTTTLPSTVAANLAACDSAVASFGFQPRDLAFNDTFRVEVGITSDQLFPVVKTGTVAIRFSESDLQNFASKTFTFETDPEDWTVEVGIFDRDDTIGGADGTDWYEQSSAFIDMQCDVIRSPAMVVSPTSTLSLWNNFRIEPMSGGTWYDRANVGIVDADESRTLLTPDGGRLYNADSSGPGTYGGCNEPEEGWADVFPTWAESTWSASAFGGVAPAGLAQLEVIYGTDPLANDDGFRFDEVTVTDVGLQVADTQGDACLAPNAIFADGFESGDTSAWSTTVP